MTEPAAADDSGHAALPEPALDSFFDDPVPMVPDDAADRIGSPGVPADGGRCHRVRIVNRTGWAMKIVRVGFGSSSSPGMAQRSSLVHAAQNYVHADEGLALQFEGGVIADGEVWEQPVSPLALNPTFSTWFALAKTEVATATPPTRPVAQPAGAAAAAGAASPDADSATDDDVASTTVPIIVLALSNPMIGTKKVDIGEGTMERWGSRDMPDCAVPRAYQEMADASMKERTVWSGKVVLRAELHKLNEGAWRWAFMLLSSDMVHRIQSFSVD
eukprot:TRINITY_DN46834_c0_g1_i1.p1 TRINITY_DN46834_c0_g1~~TRINITY_DN46834_c0_g1_i1.p1  ORF type:complete len:273 (+),score=54.89 TRINITY_DN46834_c0_g1_i1:95-913(+)